MAEVDEDRRMRDELERLQDELHKARAQLALAPQSTEGSPLENELTRLEAENGSLRDGLRALRERRAALEQERAELAREDDEERVQLRGLQARLADLRALSALKSAILFKPIVYENHPTSKGALFALVAIPLAILGIALGIVFSLVK